MHYDPKKVNVVVNGFTLTGYSDGSKVKVDPVTEEEWKTFVGVCGTVVWTKVNDERYSVTVSLYKESPSSKTLDGLRKLPSSFPVMITNKSAGKYLGGGTEARIVNKPPTEFGADSLKREYKIIVADYSEVELPE